MTVYVALRIALSEVATRDFVRSELRSLLDEVEVRSVNEHRHDPRHEAVPARVLLEAVNVGAANFFTNAIDTRTNSLVVRADSPALMARPLDRRPVGLGGALSDRDERGKRSGDQRRRRRPRLS